MASPAMYDPYNYISFVELNKRKRGDYYDRPESQRLENRTSRPAVKRIYLKKNGDDSPGKPKLYVWRQLQAPSLDQLTELAGDFVGLHDAMILYDRDGRRILHEEDIHENGTYYVAGDESFEPTNNPDTAQFPAQQPPRKVVRRRSHNPKNVPRKLLEQPLRTSVSHSDLPADPYDESILFNSISHPEMLADRKYYSISQSGSIFDLKRQENTEYLTYTSPHSQQGIRRPLKKVIEANKKRKKDKEILKEDELSETALISDYEDAYREALVTPTPSIITVDQPSTSRKQKIENNGYDYYSNERHGRSAKTRGKDDYYDDYDRRHSGAKSRGREFDDYDYDDYGSRNKQHSAPAGYHREKYSSKPKSRRARSTSSAKRELEDSMISDFHDEEAELRDRLALEKHKQRNRYARSHSAQIFNRKDQTNPNAYIIYVFLNGNGMDCQYVDFSRSQLEKGMPYVLELCARKYKVNPARLVNMDGKKIAEVSDMMSRGAYVLIPVGQNFRDTWYFLPDNAIDTSADVDKVRARSAQRDRYIQKKERDERRKTSHKRSKSSDYRR